VQVARFRLSNNLALRARVTFVQRNEKPVVVSSVTWPLYDGEAEGDLVLICERTFSIVVVVVVFM